MISWLKIFQMQIIDEEIARKRKKMKKLFSILVFLLLVYPNIAISEKQIVEIPFLFAEDEELESIETYDDILHDKSQAILKDEYLSEPLTKLDFVLIKMNEHSYSNKITLISS